MVLEHAENSQIANTEFEPSKPARIAETDMV